MPKGLSCSELKGDLPGLGIKHRSADVAEGGMAPGPPEEAASP